MLSSSGVGVSRRDVEERSTDPLGRRAPMGYRFAS